MPDITLVPMLRVQRDLYDIPADPAASGAICDTMTGGSDEIVLPLSTFNPMGRGHVPDCLDALLALDAESLAAEAIAEATQRLAGIEATFRLGLVLADDAGGGWTSRPHTEVENRFRPMTLLKRGWAVALAWTSEIPTARGIRRDVLATIDRSIAVLRHGEPRTLGQMMEQEGLAAVFAGEVSSTLDFEEIEYTREILRPHREATDLTTIIPCLYGDEAARALGSDAFGLSDLAGFSLALAEALEAGIPPRGSPSQGPIPDSQSLNSSQPNTTPAPKARARPPSIATRARAGFSLRQAGQRPEPGGIIGPDRDHLRRRGRHQGDRTRRLRGDFGRRLLRLGRGGGRTGRLPGLDQRLERLGGLARRSGSDPAACWPGACRGRRRASRGGRVGGR